VRFNRKRCYFDVRYKEYGETKRKYFFYAKDDADDCVETRNKAIRFLSDHEPADHSEDDAEQVADDDQHHSD
jgi:hypothetical protein